MTHKKHGPDLTPEAQAQNGWIAAPIVYGAIAYALSEGWVVDPEMIMTFLLSGLLGVMVLGRLIGVVLTKWFSAPKRIEQIKSVEAQWQRIIKGWVLIHVVFPADNVLKVSFYLKMKPHLKSVMLFAAPQSHRRYPMVRGNHETLEQQLREAMVAEMGPFRAMVYGYCCLNRGHHMFIRADSNHEILLAHSQCQTTPEPEAA